MALGMETGYSKDTDRVILSLLHIRYLFWLGHFWVFGHWHSLSVGLLEAAVRQTIHAPALGAGFTGVTWTFFFTRVGSASSSWDIPVDHTMYLARFRSLNASSRLLWLDGLAMSWSGSLGSPRSGGGVIWVVSPQSRISRQMGYCTHAAFERDLVPSCMTLSEQLSPKNGWGTTSMGSSASSLRAKPSMVPMSRVLFSTRTATSQTMEEVTLGAATVIVVGPARGGPGWSLLVSGGKKYLGAFLPVVLVRITVCFVGRTTKHFKWKHLGQFNILAVISCLAWRFLTSYFKLHRNQDGDMIYTGTKNVYQVAGWSNNDQIAQVWELGSVFKSLPYSRSTNRRNLSYSTANVGSRLADLSLLH